VYLLSESASRCFLIFLIKIERHRFDHTKKLARSGRHQCDYGQKFVLETMILLIVIAQTVMIGNCRCLRVNGCWLSFDAIQVLWIQVSDQNHNSFRLQQENMRWNTRRNLRVYEFCWINVGKIWNTAKVDHCCSKFTLVGLFSQCYVRIQELHC
jgi:hypothetical protein